MFYGDTRKRNAQHKYFPMPNQIFDLCLSAEEIATYAYLMHRENRKTYQCWPSYTDIGAAIGKSNKSVQKYVRGLVEKKLIYTEPTKIRTREGKVHNGNLMYTIRPIQDALTYDVEQQFMKLESDGILPWDA